MFGVFRFMKFIGKPSNAIQRNSKFRMMSKGSKKSSDDAAKCEENKDMVIRGGTKCGPKKKAPPPPPPEGDKKKAKPPSCEDMLMKKEKKPKKVDPTAIRGGGAQSDCMSKPKPPPSGDHSGCWQKISLFLVLPVIAILTILVFTTHGEHERPEFIYYPHMYKRSKPYWFGDGNRTAFHHEHWNALPPAGYEDEVDMEAARNAGETEEEKKQRLKEFEDTRKRWDKHMEKRRKEEEKARKEQEKVQMEEEKARKKEEEKAQKEEEKARKEEEKARKEEEKARKKEEQALKKQLKESPVETEGRSNVADEEKKDVALDDDYQKKASKMIFGRKNKKTVYHVDDD